jgi:hypothetical protein
VRSALLGVWDCRQTAADGPLSNSTNKSSCSDSSGSASGSGAAATGDNLEVKLTASGASGDKKLWRVMFRF